MGLTKAFGRHSGYKVQSIVPELNTIYVDPTNVTTGRDGTIEKPYNSFAEFTISDGWTYKFKLGTTLTRSSALSVTGISNVTFSTYGTGARPIFNYTGSGDYGFNFVPTNGLNIVGIDFTTPRVNNLLCLVAVGGTNLTLDTCQVYGVKGAGDGPGAGMGIRGGGTNLKILSCAVDDTDCDGIYLRDTSNLEIGYTLITRVNQKYASIGTGASGDCLQLDGTWPNFNIHHCVFDRTDANTGNKFGLICNSAVGLNNSSSGIIERNIFKTKAGSDITCALYIEKGNGIITRYNTFEGANNGIRITGQYCQNNLIHHNKFIGNAYGIGVAYLGDSPINTRIFNNVFHKCTSHNIWVDRTSVISRNNIHYPDGAAGVALYNYGSGIITHSNNCYDATKIGNGGTAPNSVTGNPSFTNSAINDYHLQPASICRSVGIDVGLTLDYDGNPITGTNVEIGIYEY